MAEGWIKVHRKIHNSPVWQEDLLTFKLWIYLLAQANFRPTKSFLYKTRGEVDVGVGELIASYESLAEALMNPKTKVTAKMVRGRIERLKAMEMIKVLPTAGCLHIRVLHYKEYQSYNEVCMSPLETFSQSGSSGSAENWAGGRAGIRSDLSPRQTRDEPILRSGVGAVERAGVGQGSVTALRSKEVKKERNLPRPVFTGLWKVDEGGNHSAEIEEIIDYLNQRIDSRYKPTTRQTQRFISGRLSEGYSVQDCKRVIDTKAKEWKGTKYQKYLRPQTLFRPANFESYVNEANSKKPSSIIGDLK